jgi:hypothetical protein
MASFKDVLNHLLQPKPYGGAEVAQLVEQRTENPRVGGSTPPLGTISSLNRRQIQLLQINWEMARA